MKASDVFSERSDAPQESEGKSFGLTPRAVIKSLVFLCVFSLIIQRAEYAQLMPSIGTSHMPS